MHTKVADVPLPTQLPIPPCVISSDQNTPNTLRIDLGAIQLSWYVISTSILWNQDPFVLCQLTKRGCNSIVGTLPSSVWNTVMLLKHVHRSL